MIGTVIPLFLYVSIHTQLGFRSRSAKIPPRPEVIVIALLPMCIPGCQWVSCELHASGRVGKSENIVTIGKSIGRKNPPGVRVRGCHIWQGVSDEAPLYLMSEQSRFVHERFSSEVAVEKTNLSSQRIAKLQACHFSEFSSRRMPVVAKRTRCRHAIEGGLA